MTATHYTLAQVTTAYNNLQTRISTYTTKFADYQGYYDAQTEEFVECNPYLDGVDNTANALQSDIDSLYRSIEWHNTFLTQMNSGYEQAKAMSDFLRGYNSLSGVYPEQQTT